MLTYRIESKKIRMKTSGYITILITSLLIVIGCRIDKGSPVIDTHDSLGVVDWQGTYFGVMPCASCPGINTLLTLNSDGTYEKTIEYIESNDMPITTKGTFERDDSREVLILGDSSYKVGENQLTLLDQNLKKIEGELSENYILIKTELEPPLDSNEGYTLESFKGSDDKDYNLVFNTNPTIPTVLITCEGFQKMLSQTQAWAKGAEYAGSNTRLIVKGDKGILTIKGRKIELHQK